MKLERLKRDDSWRHSYMRTSALWNLEDDTPVDRASDNGNSDRVNILVRLTPQVQISKEHHQNQRLNINTYLCARSDRAKLLCAINASNQETVHCALHSVRTISAHVSAEVWCECTNVSQVHMPQLLSGQHDQAVRVGLAPVATVWQCGAWDDPRCASAHGC